MFLTKNNLQLLLIIDKTVTYFNGVIKYLICSHYLHGLNLNFSNSRKSLIEVWFGFGGLWCLMPLPTIFQFNRGGQFYWGRKPEYSEKTTDLLQITDELLSHYVVSSTSRPSGIRTHNVSGDRQIA